MQTLKHAKVLLWELEQLKEFEDAVSADGGPGELEDDTPAIDRLAVSRSLREQFQHDDPEDPGAADLDVSEIVSFINES